MKYLCLVLSAYAILSSCSQEKKAFRVIKGDDKNEESVRMPSSYEEYEKSLNEVWNAKEKWKWRSKSFSSLEDTARLNPSREDFNDVLSVNNRFCSDLNSFYFDHPEYFNTKPNSLYQYSFYKDHPVFDETFYLDKNGNYKFHYIDSLTELKLIKYASNLNLKYEGVVFYSSWVSDIVFSGLRDTSSHVIYSSYIEEPRFISEQRLYPFWLEHRVYYPVYHILQKYKHIMVTNKFKAEKGDVYINISYVHDKESWKISHFFLKKKRGIIPEFSYPEEIKDLE